MTHRDLDRATGTSALVLIGLLEVFRLTSENDIRQRVIDTAAEHFEADIVAIVRDGRIVKATGIGEDEELINLVLESAHARIDKIDSPSIGPLSVAGVPIGNGSSSRLVVLRSGAPFSHEEVRICRAIVRLKRLAMEMVAAFDEQREISSQLTVEVATNRTLNRELQARHNDLMSRMIGIQAQLSSAPRSVLKTIVDHGGALFDDAVLFLHLVRDDGMLELHKLSPGAPEGLAEDLQLLDPLEVPLGRAQRTNALVVNEATEPALGDLKVQVSTPIHQQRRIVGILTVASMNDERSFARSDHETLLLLAGYASVAVSDSRIIAEREAALIEAEWQATHDPLTGLANRRLVIDTITAWLLEKRNVFILYIDIDRFKSVNDLYGHQVGDEFIIEVGRRLLATNRDGDVVGRLGGDEFVVVVADADTTVEMGYAMAERLRLALNEPVKVGDRSFALSASIGLAGSEGLSAVEVIDAADVAMYKAKSGGRNQTGLFDKALQRQIRRRANLVEGLKVASESGQGFRLAYQPIVNIASGRTSCYEVKLCYTDPTFGPVELDEFTSLAEELGLIVEADDWVLANAMAEAAAAPAPIWLSINVSPAWLASPDAVEKLEALSDRYAIPLDRISLEICERAALLQVASVILSRLRSAGVRIFLDNFGTGNSSLTYARTLNIDGIKLDPGFLDGLYNDRKTIAVLEAVMTLSDRLGAHTIAEGVETKRQADLLASLGCRSGQGSYFGQPGSASESLGSGLVEDRE